MIISRILFLGGFCHDSNAFRPCGEESLNGMLANRDKARQVNLNGIPHEVKVESAVGVRNLAAHLGDITPRIVRINIFENACIFTYELTDLSADLSNECFSVLRNLALMLHRVSRPLSRTPRVRRDRGSQRRK